MKFTFRYLTKPSNLFRFSYGLQNQPRPYRFNFPVGFNKGKYRFIYDTRDEIVKENGLHEFIINDREIEKTNDTQQFIKKLNKISPIKNYSLATRRSEMNINKTKLLESTIENIHKEKHLTLTTAPVEILNFADAVLETRSREAVAEDIVTIKRIIFKAMAEKELQQFQRANHSLSTHRSLKHLKEADFGALRQTPVQVLERIDRIADEYIDYIFSALNRNIITQNCSHLANNKNIKKVVEESKKELKRIVHNRIIKESNAEASTKKKTAVKENSGYLKKKKLTKGVMQEKMVPTEVQVKDISILRSAMAVISMDNEILKVTSDLLQRIRGEGLTENYDAVIYFANLHEVLKKKEELLECFLKFDGEIERGDKGLKNVSTWGGTEETDYKLLQQLITIETLKEEKRCMVDILAEEGFTENDIDSLEVIIEALLAVEDDILIETDSVYDLLTEDNVKKLELLLKEQIYKEKYMTAETKIKMEILKEAISRLDNNTKYEVIKIIDYVLSKVAIQAFLEGETDIPVDKIKISLGISDKHIKILDTIIKKHEIYKEDTKTLRIYKMLWFLRATKPEDWKILPWRDYPYEEEPITFEQKELIPENWQLKLTPEYWNKIEEHPIPFGSDLGTEEMAVSIEIMIDMINILIMLWATRYTGFAGYTGTQAVILLTEILYSWLMLETSIKEMDKKDSKEHYFRCYRWIRWEAEKVALKARDDMNMNGNDYISELVFELIYYMENHHFDTMPLFECVEKMDEFRALIPEMDPQGDIEFALDKLKGIRHRIIESKSKKSNE